MKPKTRDEELNIWKARITTARTVRDRYLADWIYWENIFDDNLWANSIGKVSRRQKNIATNSATQVNELESIIMSAIPKINFSMPIFEIEDTYSGNSTASLIYEFFAIRVYDLLKMYKTMREILLDTHLFGGAVHKTGITYHTDQELEDVVIDEMPVSDCVSPKNVLWDYRFNSWEDKLWIAEEYIRPLEVVMDSPLYSNTNGLKGNIDSTFDIEHLDNIKGKDDGELITLVEIHDLYNRKLMTVAMGHNKFLRYEDDYQESPYDYLEFTPSRPRRFWGKSICQSLEEQLIRYAQLNTFMDNESESGAREIFLVDTSIGNQAVKLLESRKSRVVIPIDGLTSMGNDPIRKLVVPAKTFDWLSKLNIVDRQIRTLSGSSAMDRGSHEAGVETLGEANMIAQSSEIRIKDRALLLSMFIQEIMSKMLTLSSDFIRPERIAEVIGIPAQYSQYIEPFDKMRLSVKFGSTALEYRNSHLQKLLLFVRLFPNMINQTELIKQVMNSLGLGLKDQNLILSQNTNMPAIPSTDRSGAGQGAGGNIQTATPQPVDTTGIGEF